MEICLQYRLTGNVEIFCVLSLNKIIVAMLLNIDWAKNFVQATKRTILIEFLFNFEMGFIYSLGFHTFIVNSEIMESIFGLLNFNRYKIGHSTKIVWKVSVKFYDQPLNSNLVPFCGESKYEMHYEAILKMLSFICCSTNPFNN